METVCEKHMESGAIEGLVHRVMPMFKFDVGKGKNLDKDLAEYERMLKKNKQMEGKFNTLRVDESHPHHEFEPHKKRKKRESYVCAQNNDCYDDEEDKDENDPEYELLLKRLGGNEKSSTLKYERMLKENKQMEGKFNTLRVDERHPHHEFEPHKKRKKRKSYVCAQNNDCYDDEGDKDENDPEYELILKRLGGNEKSYTLEYEVNGKQVVLKYEEDSSADDESCYPEPSKKLRSVMEQNNAPSPSRQTPAGENECNNDYESNSTDGTKNMTCRKLRNKPIRNVKCSTSEMVADSDYCHFLKDLKIVDGHLVYNYEGKTVEYEMKIKQKEQSDDSSSDVEIIDRTSFYKKGNANIMVNEDNSFRHQVISLLSKPFDKKEYGKLKSDVKRRMLKVRHMDLRNGRERSYSARKMGKSYLDYYHGLRRRYRQFRNDKPRRLSILRGFFFWLQNSVQEGSFQPWEDASCLAIKPKSR